MEQTTVSPERRAARGSAAGAAQQPRQGNTKMAVFFTSLLPLGLAFGSLTFLWLTCYAAAVAKAGDVLRRPRIRRVLDAVARACPSRSACASQPSTA